MNKKIPTRLLEQAALGELDATKLQALEKRCGGEQELQKQLESLRHSNQEILEKLPASEFSQIIEQRLAAQQHRERVQTEFQKSSQKRLARSNVAFGGWRTWTTAVSTLFLFALLGPWQGDNLSTVGCRGQELNNPETQLMQKSDIQGPANTSVAVSPQRPKPDNSVTLQSEDGVRLKGADEALVVYKRTPEGDLLLRSGAKLMPGDLLQLHVRTAKAKYVMVYSIDSKGTVTWMFPEKAGTSPKVTEGIKALPHSYELDSTLGTERFYLLTSDGEFNEERVKPIIQHQIDRLKKSPASNAQSSTIPGIQQVAFEMEKIGLEGEKP